jgi:hypothetical protein
MTGRSFASVHQRTALHGVLAACTSPSPTARAPTSSGPRRPLTVHAFVASTSPRPPCRTRARASRGSRPWSTTALPSSSPHQRGVGRQRDTRAPLARTPTSVAQTTSRSGGPARADLERGSTSALRCRLRRAQRLAPGAFDSSGVLPAPTPHPPPIRIDRELLREERQPRARSLDGGRIDRAVRELEVPATTREQASRSRAASRCNRA